MTGYPLSVLPQHHKLLAASAIDPEVARERGYVSADTKRRLETAGFKDYQRRVPGLLIPVHDVTGAVALWQYRPDCPRVTKAGKAIKYETPGGARMVLDIPPRVRDQLGDVKVPLWITEGCRKADAAVSAGLCCAALLGVWNWRGTNSHGATTALGDWETIALKGRRVYLAFDSDAMTKPAVHAALSRFGAFLAGRGADVRFCYLPGGDDGAKTGLDDYLASGGSTDDLIRTATPALSDPGPQRPAEPAQQPPKRAATAQDGAVLLGEVHDMLGKYVVFPSPEAADAAALYSAATYAQHKLQFAPRLNIKSPVKRCGKTLLLDVLAQLVHRPLITVDISAAALVRSVGDDPPTIILDEADAVFGKGLKGDEKAEHLRGILNAGFGRDRPYIRWDMNARAAESCPTFAMAIIAGIGALPDTIEDRSVVITLRRKATHERVDKYRLRRDKPAVAKLGERLAAWIEPHAERLGDAEPTMPPGLNDRAEDVWEALLAVADLAGGDWPRRARAAAVALSADAEEDAGESSRLLSDHEALHTETVLTGLHEIAEAPWGDYFGRPLTARDLAKLLKPYNVKACDVKIGGTNRRGYRRDRLHDEWSRYLPPGDGVSATSATCATSQVSEGAPVAGSTSDVLPATSHEPLTSAVAEVAQVALTPSDDGCGTTAERGNCTRCGAACRRYGPHGHPLCDDCRDSQAGESP